MTEGCVGIVFALLNGVAICWPKSSCNHFTYLQGFITVSLSSVDASWNNFAFDDDSWSTAYEVDNFWPTDVRDVHTVDAPWVWCGSSNNVEGTAYFRYKVFPQDCTEVYARGYITSGVYRIDPDGGGTIEVYCDLSESPTDGSTTGGWLVFQRRKDNSKDFYRGWSDYVQGFGDLDGNVWLGLDNLARILNSGSYELHVFLEAFELNDTAYAKYTTFHITDASVNYRLTIGGYSGTAGDCMAYHNGMEFSTHDADHDAHTSRNCGQYFRGAFWYRTCHCANLNGQYLGGVHTSYADGIEWASYKGHYYSLKTSVMKIRKL